MAMSAMKRVNEKVNLNMLIDILRGSGKRDLMAQGYQHIKTYGAGRDLPFADWRSYIGQMIEQGFIAIDYSAYGQLKLTSLAAEVLFQNQKVNLVKFVWEDKKAKKPKPAVRKTDFEIDEGLFEVLRKLRSSIASEQGVPAYVVFPNKTLEELSAVKPVDMLSFSLVNGVGKMKLEKYGQVFIDEIKANI